MRQVMRNTDQPEERRGEMAKAAARYLHPPLSPRDEPVKLEPMRGSLAIQGNKVLTALCQGCLTPAEATTIMQAIGAQARIIEVDELGKRVKALEDRNGKESGAPNRSA